MPYTVNGIGTTYLFSRNKVNRKAVCEFCNHEATLTTYDTSYCFAVLFIPIIPLGRKKIVDQCSACQMHRAVPLKTWEQNKQTAISQATQDYRQTPTARNGLNLHGVLLAFQEFDQASQFQKTLLESFPDNAEVLAGLADHYSSRGLEAEAAGMRERAYELDPESPEARLGKAWNLMHQNQPDQARALVHFLEEPGAHQNYDMMPLIVLAQLFQKKGDHQQAMELFASLLTAFPNSGQHHAVRKAVLQSEKALGLSSSILPPIKHNVSGFFSSQYSPEFKKGVGFAVLAAIVLIGFALNNEYIRRNRQLRILNATGQAISYSLDGQPAQVSNDSDLTLSVSEGSHTLVFDQPIKKEYTIDVTSSYFDRWTCRPVWIVNVNGEGIVLLHNLFYAVNPPPSTQTALIDEVIVRRHIDFPFTDIPEEMDVEKKEVKKRTAMQLIETPPIPYFNYLLLAESFGNRAQAYDYARRVMERIPDDENLLNMVHVNVHDQKYADFANVLKQKCQEFPDNPLFHLAYVRATKSAEQRDADIQFYQDKHQAEPDNAVWTMMVAVQEPMRERKIQLLEQAIKQDPELWDAHGALMRCYIDQQDYPEALLQMEAIDRDWAEGNLNREIHQLTLAVPSFGKEVLQILEQGAEDTPNLADQIHQVDLLQSLNQTRDIPDILSSARLESSPLWQTEEALLARLKYTGGDYLVAQQTAKQLNMPHLILAAYINIEFGDLMHPNSFQPTINGMSSDFALLRLIRSAADSQDPTIQRLWQQKIVKQFQMLGGQFQVWSEVFANPDSKDSLEKARQLYLTIGDRPVYLTALAVLCKDAEMRKVYQQEAQQTLLSHLPPYRLLTKTWEQLD